MINSQIRIQMPIKLQRLLFVLLPYMQNMNCTSVTAVTE